jgi:hypothetical protein
MSTHRVPSPTIPSRSILEPAAEGQQAFDYIPRLKALRYTLGAMLNFRPGNAALRHLYDEVYTRLIAAQTRAEKGRR